MDFVVAFILVGALLLGWLAVQQVKKRDRAQSTRMRAYRQRMHAPTASARSEMRAAEDTTTLMTTIRKAPRTQPAQRARSRTRTRSRS